MKKSTYKRYRGRILFFLTILSLPCVLLAKDLPTDKPNSKAESKYLGSDFETCIRTFGIPDVVTMENNFGRWLLSISNLNLGDTNHPFDVVGLTKDFIKTHKGGLFYLELHYSKKNKTLILKSNKLTSVEYDKWGTLSENADENEKKE